MIKTLALAGTAAALVLGFFFPGWNMLAMLPMVLLPARVRA